MEALYGDKNMAVGGRFLKGPRALRLAGNAPQALGENPMLSAQVFPPSQMARIC